MKYHIDINVDLNTIFKTLPLMEIEHMRRVSALVRTLAPAVRQHIEREVALVEYEYFGKAALYHDIGKAWVPLDLLMKSDKLSDQEYTQIKMHTFYAQKYIVSHPQLFRETSFSRKLVFNAAVFHHERWDGTGYPFGLKHKQIPLNARITSVCDAYDAITSFRPYRATRSHEEACKEIEMMAGKQFDPAIADAFLNLKTAIAPKNMSI